MSSLASLYVGGNLDDVGTIKGNQLQLVAPAVGSDTTTQTVQAHFGAAATPSITFAGDSDTGLFRSAANVLGVAVAGAVVGTWTTGGYQQTDAQVWIPASMLPTIYFTVGTWTNTRIAAGNYGMVHTDGDETSTIEIPISPYIPYRTTASTGIKINTIQYAWINATNAMDAHSYDILDVQYANNSATVVGTALGGTLTGTLITTASTSPQVVTITAGTPFYLGALDGILLQVTANHAAASHYTCLGAFVNVTYTL